MIDIGGMELIIVVLLLVSKLSAIIVMCCYCDIFSKCGRWDKGSLFTQRNAALDEEAGGDCETVDSTSTHFLDLPPSYEEIFQIASTEIIAERNEKLDAATDEFDPPPYSSLHI